MYKCKTCDKLLTEEYGKMNSICTDCHDRIMEESRHKSEISKRIFRQIMQELNQNEAIYELAYKLNGIDMDYFTALKSAALAIYTLYKISLEKEKVNDK